MYHTCTRARADVHTQNLKIYSDESCIRETNYNKINFLKSDLLRLLEIASICIYIYIYIYICMYNFFYIIILFCNSISSLTEKFS